MFSLAEAIYFGVYIACIVHFAIVTINNLYKTTQLVSVILKKEVVFPLPKSTELIEPKLCISLVGLYIAGSNLIIVLWP